MTVYFHVDNKREYTVYVIKSAQNAIVTFSKLIESRLSIKWKMMHVFFLFKENV